MSPPTSPRLRSPLLPLVRALTAEGAPPPALFLFAAGGTAAAFLPGAGLGGREVAVWGLGALLVAAALQGGLGGIFAPGGLYRAPWLHAQPPARLGRALAATLALWISLGLLLLPGLLLPLWAWSARGGETRHPIEITQIEYNPGPEEVLQGLGEVTLTCAGGRDVHQIRFTVIPLFHSREILPVPLAASLDGGAWNPLGRVDLEPESMAFAVDRPRPLRTIRIRRLAAAGQPLRFPREDFQVLGVLQGGFASWFWPWLAAWNTATAVALGLALLGSLISRPLALVTGAAWAVLALAEPAFKPGFPAEPLARGVAWGPDLGDGRGWVPLAAALLCALLLPLRPGVRPGEEK